MKYLQIKNDTPAPVYKIRIQQKVLVTFSIFFGKKDAALKLLIIPSLFN